MQFHVHAHKPDPPEKKARFPWWSRLLIGGLGAYMAWAGSLPRNPANFMYKNWRGQEVYPNAFWPIGVLVVVVCLIPVAWIDRAVKRLVR